MENLEKAETDLANIISQLTTQQRDLSLSELRLMQLKRNVSIAEDLYSMFKRRYEEARILEAEKNRDVSIIELALTPTKPVKPNTRSNMLIGIFSGLLEELQIQVIM